MFAKHCRKLWATDLEERELENAKINFERFNALSGNKCAFETFRGNLLEPLPVIPAKAIPLIIFNHPFYPSPHKLYGTGGMHAGLAVIRPFLEAAVSIVAKRGAVIMPFSEVSGGHNPLTIAIELGYSAKAIRQSRHNKYGELYIYLFTR